MIDYNRGIKWNMYVKCCNNEFFWNLVINFCEVWKCRNRVLGVLFVYDGSGVRRVGVVIVFVF